MVGKEAVSPVDSCWAELSVPFTLVTPGTVVIQYIYPDNRLTLNFMVSFRKIHTILWDNLVVLWEYDARRNVLKYAKVSNAFVQVNNNRTRVRVSIAYISHDRR